MPIKAEAAPWSYTFKEDFPVKVYYKGENFRIIHTEGIAHNTRWMHHLRDSDQVIASIPFNATPDRFRLEKEFLEAHRHRIENWHILCNTEEQAAACIRLGLQGYLVNHNCFLDENLFQASPAIPKIYDAVYNARPEAWKRHDLAARIPNLALIVGYHFKGHETIDINAVPHVYRNPERLTPAEVNRKIQEAKCGLCLSLAEGACYASGEFLLSGVPVVSVKSNGGRDLWYHWQNSIVCDPTVEDVANAVRVMGDRVDRGEMDPWLIRNLHIRQSWEYRMNFVEVLRGIFKRCKVNIDAHAFFIKTFTHKMVQFVPLEEALQRLEVCESDSPASGPGFSHTGAGAGKTLIDEGMDFSVKKNGHDFSRCFLGSGWSGVEEEFVWSEGKEAGLKLEFPNGGRKRLYLDLAAFLPGAEFRQNIVVTAGDVQVGAVTFTQQENRGRHYFDLAESLGKSVVLTIRVERPVSPLEAKISGDSRKLGVALHGLGLVDAQATAGAAG